MNEGDVALMPLPQADGKIKNRPVIILRKMPLYRRLLQHLSSYLVENFK